jgi:hypothetical protein
VSFLRAWRTAVGVLPSRGAMSTASRPASDRSLSSERGLDRVRVSSFNLASSSKARRAEILTSIALSWCSSATSPLFILINHVSYHRVKRRHQGQCARADKRSGILLMSFSTSITFSQHIRDLGVRPVANMVPFGTAIEARFCAVRPRFRRADRQPSIDDDPRPPQPGGQRRFLDNTHADQHGPDAGEEVAEMLAHTDAEVRLPRGMAPSPVASRFNAVFLLFEPGLLVLPRRTASPGHIRRSSSSFRKARSAS